jgi:hypothetical protein
VFETNYTRFNVYPRVTDVGYALVCTNWAERVGILFHEQWSISQFKMMQTIERTNWLMSYTAPSNLKDFETTYPWVIFRVWCIKQI